MRLILVSVVAVAIAGVLATLWYRSATAGPVIPKDAIFSEVSVGPFVHSVIAEGTTESSNNVEIECHVSSRNTASSGTAILWVIPESTLVEEGDVVVKLDASALEVERDTQKIACNTSHALKEQAKNTYEAAIEAKREYIEGTYEQERKLILNELFLAEEKLRRAKLSYDSGVDLVAKSLVTELQLEGDLVSLEKAQNEVDLAELKLRVLDELTKEKQRITLDSDIATAKAQWGAEEESYALELKKLNDLEEQIRNCEIKAPSKGQIVYANDYDYRGNSEFVVAAGALVREGQTILRIPDPARMQVRSMVNESQVGLVDSGMPVTIRLRALGGVEIAGEVNHVNTYHEPLGWSRSTKEYATIVEVKDNSHPIRAGLTASSEIVVNRISNAVQIPVQAVTDHGGKRYCLVRNGDAMETREIEVSASNDVKMVVTSDNLKPGEEVVLNPRRYDEFLELPVLAPEEEVSEEAEAVAAEAAEADGAPAGAVAGGRGAAGGPGTGGPGAGPGGPAGPGGAGGGGRDPAEMMKRLDSNGDGSLSKEELASVPEQFRTRLTALDKDADGSISADELKALAAMGGPGRGGPAGPGGPGEGAPGAGTPGGRADAPDSRAAAPAGGTAAVGS
jgi:multidrug efflux pump subunit AcrA (membrane-fusion protein)